MNPQSAVSDKPTLLLTANSAWNIVNFRLGLIEGLSAEGFRVCVAAPADGTESRLADKGITFNAIQMKRSGMNPVTDLKLLLAYRRLMRTLRPAGFLGFTIKPNIYGSLAAQSLGIPIINNVSGLGTMFLAKSWQTSLASGLYRLALRQSATVFFQNPDDMDLFLAKGITRIGQSRLLPGSGVDLNRFSAVPMGSEDPLTFLFIGRLLADKGVREFVDAARLVRRRYPSARFELLGGSDPGNRTAIPAEEIESWRREGNVHLNGHAEDVRAHIARAHAVVLPSYREGLPRVLLEAAAMGRPLIATDVPGCRTIVSNGHNGFLCAARDSQSLAGAIERIIEMPLADREAMGTAARATVEQGYDEQHVISLYAEALRAIGVTSGVSRR